MSTTKDPTKNNFKNFIVYGSWLFFGMIIFFTGLFRFLAPSESFFFRLAAAIVVSWILILTLYYIWAIYFYNINRTWTDKDWENHEKDILVQGTSKEPDIPNSEETLGLPKGTVRGTIALSVLVGGMAMMVASLAMPGRLAQNEFLVDNFEYIKTAFLMVIAFYFGSKSLEFINRTQVFGQPGTGSTEQAQGTQTPTRSATVQPVVPPSGISPVTVVGDISRGAKGEAEPDPFEDRTAQG